MGINVEGKRVGVILKIDIFVFKFPIGSGTLPVGCGASGLKKAVKPSELPIAGRH